jgi:hypothetical protein
MSKGVNMNKNEIKSHIGRQRVFTDPTAKRKVPVSLIRDEIKYPKDLEGGWGKYHFEAWLEEEIDDPGYFTISFIYYRKKDDKSPWKFAGQTSFRAEPCVVRFLFEEMTKRGWLWKKGWSD